MSIPYLDKGSSNPKLAMNAPSPAEQWTPEQRGRALHFIVVLANTPPSGWRSKQEIYEALAEFRTPETKG